MWVSALFGMCTKYAEGTLAVHYREINANGELVGGPMYYIKNGLSKKWHWLAYLFAAFGVLTVFGTGNATQVNTITTAIDSALFNYGIIEKDSVGTLNLIIGIVLAIMIGMILLGGIKRIGQVTEKLVPFMAAIYVILALGVVVLNFQNIPSVFGSIFEGAFSPASVTGGAVGSFYMSWYRFYRTWMCSYEKACKSGIFRNLRSFYCYHCNLYIDSTRYSVQRCSSWIWRGGRSRTYYSWIYIHLWKLGIYLYSGCNVLLRIFYDYRMGFVRNEMCGISSWYKSE